MNIGQAQAAVDVLRALRGDHVDADRLEDAKQLLAKGAAKALQLSPDSILRGK